MFFERIVEVFVFDKDMSPFDIEVEKYVNFGIISCFIFSLVIKLHDRGHVIVGIEFSVVEYVYSELKQQGFFKQEVLIIIVRIHGNDRQGENIFLGTFLEVDGLVEVEVP